ncbi:secreted RxLR effector protein 161-like [Apium graveolens]|uniref:secreted RxLR effector protein 161-like n=1 Tax=Apium graveolens TaxID=4045 RepID=UPI003D7B5938
MEDCNEVSNHVIPGSKIDFDEDGEKGDETLYKQIIGSLTYLTNTRPDLKFIVSFLSRYMSRPIKLHFLAAKRVLRYLKGTLDYGDVDGRKSTSGYTFMMGGGGVAWSSKKQSVVALSTT